MEKINKFIEIINYCENNNYKYTNKSKKPYLLYWMKKKEMLDVKTYLQEQLPDYNILLLTKKNILDFKNKNFKMKKDIIITNLDYQELEDLKDDFYLIDYTRLTSTKHYLFPANFKTFHFGKLYDEEKINKDYEGILWSNSTHVSINIGDIVYVYYSGMVDGINRILLKCEVIDDGFHFGKNENEICPFVEDDEYEEYLTGTLKQEDYNRGLRLRCVYGINTKKRQDFSYKSLTTSYGLKALRGKIKLTEEYQSLITDLENISKDEKYSLLDFRNMFKPECMCKDLFSGSHKTFEKENGLYHYEIHHLIEQYHTRKKGKAKVSGDIIYNVDNEISLCLNCHSRIHIGKIEDRIKMVEYLYHNNKKAFDKLLDQIPSAKNNKLQWLLEQYVSTKE